MTGEGDWRGRVSVIEPTGADTYVVLDTPGGSITARVSPNTALSVGESVALAVTTDAPSWFDATTGARC